MKGQYGVPMQAHSRFKTREEYIRWLRCKNRGINKPKKEVPKEPKHYRYLKDGEWVDVYVDV